MRSNEVNERPLTTEPAHPTEKISGKEDNDEKERMDE
jgi:hypothetical protein